MNLSCPSCQAKYSVDDSRLPATGLKMRCPKCATNFLVTKAGAAPLADAAVPLPAASGAPPARRQAAGAAPGGSVPLPGSGSRPAPPRAPPGASSGAVPLPGLAPPPGPPPAVQAKGSGPGAVPLPGGAPGV
ncbi:MAG: zinc-ribbon domain-containing protein, partial [Deltaproteobacteria bacterium]